MWYEIFFPEELPCVELVDQCDWPVQVPVVPFFSVSRWFVRLGCAVKAVCFAFSFGHIEARLWWEWVVFIAFLCLWSMSTGVYGRLNRVP